MTRRTTAAWRPFAGACAAGLGLILARLLGVRELIDRGLLVEVLPLHPAPPMPVTLLYAHRRHLPQRVRVVMDWLGAVVQTHLQREADADARLRRERGAGAVGIRMRARKAAARKRHESIGDAHIDISASSTTFAFASSCAARVARQTLP